MSKRNTSIAGSNILVAK